MRIKHLGASVAVLLVVTRAAAAAGEVGLIDAVKRGDTSALGTLLKQKADVNAPTADGTTALHWAAHRNDLKAAELLIRAGANAKAANRYGVTPLSLAAEKGS